MTSIKFYKDTVERIQNSSIKNGAIYAATDKALMAYDTNDTRYYLENATCDVQIKTNDEWNALSKLILPAGTLLLYTDRSKVGGKDVFDIKIADGAKTVEDLSFFIEGKEQEAAIKNILEENMGSILETKYPNIFNRVAVRVEHKLTIGDDKVFDGSEDVHIPIYNGE